MRHPLVTEHDADCSCSVWTRPLVVLSGKGFFTKIIAPLLIFLLGLAPSVQAQNADAQLSLAISLLQKTVKAGSDVTVNISLTTNSGRPVKITWSNNDEPRDSEYGLDVQDENGKTPRRTQLGRVVVDKVPAVAVDSIHLPNRDVQEGETLNQRLVLNRFFDLAAPGKYTVQLVRHEGNTKSNLVSFTIEPK